MKIEIFSFPLQNEIKEKVVNILDENFGEKAGKDPKTVEESKNTHYSNPTEYILYFDGGKIIAIQNIFLREIDLESQKILIGGLGGLCVDKAMKKLERLGCDIGMLFTDIHNSRFQKLYGQFGFVILNKSYSFLDKFGQLHTDNYAMIAPLNSKRKFNLMVNSKETLHLGAGEW